MERNRIDHNESVHLGGLVLGFPDFTRLSEIAQLSVCRVSLLIGDRELGHGSSFIYKQVINRAIGGSKLFLFTNAHVINMLYGAYEVLPLMYTEKPIKDCQVDLVVYFGDKQYSIKHAWLPKLYHSRNNALPFRGDYAIFSIDSEETEELDFFSICVKTLERLSGEHDIYLCGYPGSAGLTVRKGIIKNLGATVRDTVQHNLMITLGDSGGPTLLDTGQVVGISVGITDHERFGSINSSMDIRHVLDVVKKSSNMEHIDIHEIIKRRGALSG
jgi:hypothetical protein